MDHFGDPCIYCDTPHDLVAPGPCPGRPGLDREADLQLTIDALLKARLDAARAQRAGEEE